MLQYQGSVSRKGTQCNLTLYNEWVTVVIKFYWCALVWEFLVLIMLTKIRRKGTDRESFFSYVGIKKYSKVIAKKQIAKGNKKWRLIYRTDSTKVNQAGWEVRQLGPQQGGSVWILALKWSAGNPITNKIVNHRAANKLLEERLSGSILIILPKLNIHKILSSKHPSTFCCFLSRIRL